MDPLDLGRLPDGGQTRPVDRRGTARLNVPVQIETPAGIDSEALPAMIEGTRLIIKSTDGLSEGWSTDGR